MENICTEQCRQIHYGLNTGVVEEISDQITLEIRNVIETSPYFYNLQITIGPHVALWLFIENILGQEPKRDHRESNPPDTHQQKRKSSCSKARLCICSGKTEGRGVEDQDKIHDHKQDAPIVPHRISLCADGIIPVFRYNFRQERIIKHEAARIANACKN